MFKLLVGKNKTFLSHSVPIVYNKRLKLFLRLGILTNFKHFNFVDIFFSENSFKK